MFEEIDRLVWLSAKPLANEYLEELQERNVSPEKYYRFLYHLVSTRKPMLSLEIGLLHGLGSLHMAIAAKEFGGHVIGLDITTDFLWDVEIEKLDNFSYIVDKSSVGRVQKVREVVNQYGKIGLVYQDSAHHYYESWEEFELYQEFLTDDAIWIVDDVTLSFHDEDYDPPDRGMVEYFVELPYAKRTYWNVLHKGSTQGVVLIGR